MLDRFECCDGETIFELVTYVFVAGAVTCFLLALHRIAGALKLGARAKALEAVGDELPGERREVLVRKIATHAVNYL